MSPKDYSTLPSTMANQQYCLKWNNHQVNLLRAFDRLLQSESFTDVTLACEGRSLRAHKVVLSACSSYFESLFEEHPDKSPIIILKDMKFSHVSQLVNFMYRGEINITQDVLSGLLRTAETLKIKGLAEVSSDQPPPHIPVAHSAVAAAAAAVNAAALTQTNFRLATPQMLVPKTSALTAALNAPIGAPPPLAALLSTEPCLSSDPLPLVTNVQKTQLPQTLKDIAKSNADESPINPKLLKRLSQDKELGAESTPMKLQRKDVDDEVPPSLSPIQPICSMSSDQSPETPPGVLAPIPPELAVKSKDLPEFLKEHQVFRLSDYLGFRTRQQFWEELSVRRLMDGIKGKEIDMKSAAEILGVSYGTLYGRYREVYGYLKHSWINKPVKGSSSKEKSIWEEARAQDLIKSVLSKELSLTAAAVRLGVDTNTFFRYLTDNGKNLARVSLLVGNDYPDSNGIEEGGGQRSPANVTTEDMNGTVEEEMKEVPEQDGTGDSAQDTNTTFTEASGLDFVKEEVEEKVEEEIGTGGIEG